MYKLKNQVYGVYNILMSKKTSSKIPKSLQWVLWSVDVNKLDKGVGDKNFRGLVFFIYWRD